MGVLVDDLVNRGVTEPYRMFTSRAEYRLSLREDNADWRLTEIGYRLGLVDDVRWTAFNRKRDEVVKEVERLKSTWVHPGILTSEEATAVVGQPLEREYTLADLLRRPGVTYPALVHMKNASGEPIGEGLPYGQSSEQVEIQIKYEGYIQRQQQDVDRQKQLAEQPIPDDLDYDSIKTLSYEVRHKLKIQKPATVGAASRISGVTPAAVSTLLIYLKRHGHQARGKSVA
jgi:tRNA uridine 5-carboxymethylaminomethyl modification enzyme